MNKTIRELSGRIMALAIGLTHKQDIFVSYHPQVNTLLVRIYNGKFDDLDSNDIENLNPDERIAVKINQDGADAKLFTIIVKLESLI